MNKISLTIKIPAVQKSAEFLVPSGMTVKKAKELILKILDEEFGTKTNPDKILLIDLTDGLAFRNDETLEKQGLLDGACLMLM